MTLGTLTLAPAFDPAETAYQASTTNATNKLTITAAEGAEITVQMDGTDVAAGTDGKYTLQWKTGENVVTVTVTNGTERTDYTITVAKA